MNLLIYYSRKQLEFCTGFKFCYWNRQKLTTLHDDDKNDHKLFCQVCNKFFG